VIIAVIALLAVVAGGFTHLDNPMLLRVVTPDAKSGEISLLESQLSSDVWAGQMCWRPPVDRPISDPFRLPECKWCSGNRGVKFGAEPGDEVRSVVTGTVWFHGTVGSTGYLTLLVEGSVVSLLVTIGGIEVLDRYPRGSVVAAGDPVGQAKGTVHLGIRSNGHYLDPELWLSAAPNRVRLVPVTEPPRPAQIRTSCSSGYPGENPGRRR
jgi:murein DD-endopeptidase MepM/ murein hydrolase activator NlpD